MATSSNIRMQYLGRLAVVLFVAFAGLQLIRPELNNPPVTAELQAPPEVKGILKNSCYSCHSNETKLRWFDKIVPAYWLVVKDVKQARMRLNFSEIGAKPAAQQKAALFEAFNQVQLGAMPLPSFKRLHPGAVVSADQLAIFRNYLTSLTPAATASETAVTAARAQYEKWIEPGHQSPMVQTELNGLAFLPDYKNWRAISSTDRFDNGTMREILGNDIAINALAQNQINPWPDGAALAKVTWLEQADDKSFAQTGAFVQVELMIKDKQKYASTLGWGFGRWRGMDLKPYGANAEFASECTGCHTPVRASDYVYTNPLKTTTMAGDLPANPLQWKVITSAIDKPASTMYTLFGNDLAVQYARSNSQQRYPAGAVLALVNWKQKDDERWFGGKIPTTPKSVEFVTITASGYSYRNFEGTPLKQVSAQTGATPNGRAAYLLAQRAAVMP